MNVEELRAALLKEQERRSYFTGLELLDLMPSVIKARLYVSPTLFVQVYRNDRFDTTNLVLLYNGGRLYARDKVGGRWHRHSSANPGAHDYSTEGAREVDLEQFLDEVEGVLAELNLP